MTAVEYLNQVGYIDRKIKVDLMELEELRARAVSVSSPAFGERVQSTRSTEPPFVRVLERIWEKESRLNQELMELEEKREEVKAVIEQLENPDERFVLLYRYINRMTWEEIGLELHVGRTTLHRWHKDAIAKIKVPN